MAFPERARTWGPFGEVLVDTPLVSFFCRDGKWHVESREYIPGPGPGDFRDEWCTAEEAVADILDFFFGDATRMNAKSRESRMAAMRKSADERQETESVGSAVRSNSVRRAMLPWSTPRPRKAMCVFRDAAQMASIWRDQGGEDSKMPTVDFATSIVIAIFEEPGSYTSARVIAQVIPKGGAIYVIVEDRPSPWSMINPRSVVSVPRMEGEIVFVQSGTPAAERILIDAEEI